MLYFFVLYKAFSWPDNSKHLYLNHLINSRDFNGELMMNLRLKFLTREVNLVNIHKLCWQSTRIRLSRSHRSIRGWIKEGLSITRWLILGLSPYTYWEILQLAPRCLKQACFRIPSDTKPITYRKPPSNRSSSLRKLMLMVKQMQP